MRAQPLQAERLHVVARHDAAANHRLAQRLERHPRRVLPRQMPDQAAREAIARAGRDRAGSPAETPGN